MLVASVAASAQESTAPPPAQPAPSAQPQQPQQPAVAQPQPTQPAPTQPAPTAQPQPAPSTGPTIVMPPPEPPAAPAPGADAPQPVSLERGVDPSVANNQSYATDLGAGRRIPIGAYGEAHLVLSHDNTQLRLRRVVLFFGYRFADWVSVYSELEVEDVKDVEIEQSYLELTPFRKRWLGFRVGLVLIPLGIINQNHEPPTFNGVDRPLVDQLIIPSTWREIGGGVFGDIVQGLHYQAYVVAGSDGGKFTADGGFGPGLSRGFQINTENWAVTGRVNWNRVLGLDVGFGFYYGTANNKDLTLSGISVGLVEADARYTRWGLQLRAEYARYFVGGADQLTRNLRLTAPTAAAIGSAGQGFYAEAGYNVLHLLHRTEQQVVPFARYELVDTRAALPDVADPLPTAAQQFVTLGVTYRPLLQLALKFDYRRTVAGNDGSGGQDRFSFGIGFMY
jgi:hypothetical protein